MTSGGGDPDPPFDGGDPAAPATIAIVGAGQVGTMLGMRLLAARADAREDRPPIGRLPIGRVTLFDRDPATLEASLQRGAADAVSTGPRAVFEADIVILALPVPQIVDVLRTFGPQARSRTLVLDTGSTKRAVVEAMAAHLPAGTHAIGGHPIAGTEVAGPHGADPDRLIGATFVLTPVRPDDIALATASALVETVGAVPIHMGAEDHDRGVAMTSHLPHLVAFALAAAAGTMDREAIVPLLGSGFRDTTRLAASDPDMVAGFLTANGDGVAAAADAFRRALDAVERLLHDPDALTERLARSRAARASLLAGRTA